MKVIDLSHPIVSGMPQWPGDEAPLRIVRRSEHGPGSHQSSSLEFGCHIGTHIDTPLHFLDGQAGLEEMPPEAFVGPALVIDARKATTVDASLLDGADLAAVDFVLLWTGWQRHWGGGNYYDGWPVPEADFVERLCAADLKGFGLDTPNVDPYAGSENHDRLAAAGMINIENLANLDTIGDRSFTLLALPLRLTAAEASPVRAVALF